MLWYKKEKKHEILAGASDYASGEFASTDLPDKRKDVFLKARTDRHIQTNRNKAAESYYKEVGRYCDYSDAGQETYVYVAAKVFVQLLFIGTANLILYLPTYYVIVPWWGGVSEHDNLYVTLLINTVIGAVLSSLWSESILKRKAFIAGMNAEAADSIVGESHLLSQSIIFRTPNQSKKIKNLYYVGAGTLPGIGLPMCLIGAELTFKKITNNRKPGPLSEGVS